MLEGILEAIPWDDLISAGVSGICDIITDFTDNEIGNYKKRRGSGFTVSESIYESYNDAVKYASEEFNGKPHKKMIQGVYFVE